MYLQKVNNMTFFCISADFCGSFSASVGDSHRPGRVLPGRPAPLHLGADLRDGGHQHAAPGQLHALPPGGAAAGLRGGALLLPGLLLLPPLLLLAAAAPPGLPAPRPRAGHQAARHLPRPGDARHGHGRPQDAGRHRLLGAALRPVLGGLRGHARRQRPAAALRGLLPAHAVGVSAREDQPAPGEAAGLGRLGPDQEHVRGSRGPAAEEEAAEGVLQHGQRPHAAATRQQRSAAAQQRATQATVAGQPGGLLCVGVQSGYRGACTGACAEAFKCPGMFTV